MNKSWHRLYNETTYIKTKMRSLPLLLLTFCSMLTAGETPPLIIGFGSCAEQHEEQLIWNKIAVHNPELFIMMGDNVYADTNSPDKISEAYEMLAKNPNFAKFRSHTPLIATWDDHDYGKTDGGRNFSAKEYSKKVFVEFFDYPELNRIKNKDRGVYHTKWLDYQDKQIQIIMLDTRWNRDSLSKSYLTAEQRKRLNLGPYQPTKNKKATLLGRKQWRWLSNELEKPADFRFLVSSIEVINEFSGYESWANFPHERKKLFDLLNETNHDNLMILSGDIHKAELSKLDYKGQQYIEATSSGLAVYIYPASNNKHRLGSALEERNYGILEITDHGKIAVTVTIYNDKGEAKLIAKVGG